MTSCRLSDHGLNLIIMDRLLISIPKKSPGHFKNYLSDLSSVSLFELSFISSLAEMEEAIE